MGKLIYLYGMPVYVDNIDSKKYKKNKIIFQIEKNYSISNIRNNWSGGSYIKTDIHHSHNDTNNKTFEEINYYNLASLYDKIIINFFKKLVKKNNFKYKFNIVNYTCARHNSFMTPHIHDDCSFSLIHYVSFDEKQHLSTIFKSPYYFQHLIPNGEFLRKTFCNLNMENSWLNKEWMIKTKEDDVIIVPSVMEHYVRNFDSNKSRITIAANIQIEKI